MENEIDEKMKNNDNNKLNSQKESSSFRDPNGFIFSKNSEIYRQINKEYKENYDFLMESGLYKELVDSKLMVAHEEVDTELTGNAYKIIKPEMISFISYPYEWCFNQLKDAALLTLKIQRIALKHGMMLKDCTAFNIQFKDNKPIFIDTLSFEKYKEGTTWAAPYRQFCRHFLAPISLIYYKKDMQLGKLSQTSIDGISLELASTLLPLKTKLNSLFFHIHINSSLRVQTALNKSAKKKKVHEYSKEKLLKTVESLEKIINKMKRKQTTLWKEYYSKHLNYSSNSFDHKKDLVSKYLDRIKPKTVLDCGANTGVFSYISTKKGIFTIAIDNDPEVIEQIYMDKHENILPLLVDLKNPSPNIGWNNEERKSFLSRVPVDTVMALALIHHLAISNNVPFDNLAKSFSEISKFLIIEFIPKSDSNLKKLLLNKKDIFHNYNQESFENEFKKHFNIIESEKINESGRVLYLMEKKP